MISKTAKSTGASKPRAIKTTKHALRELKPTRRTKALSQLESDRRSRDLAQAHGVPAEVVYQLEAARSAARAAITFARDAKARCSHGSLASELGEAIDGLKEIVTEYLTPDLRTFGVRAPILPHRRE